jgi:ubiquinone/menaquinone biosynthesis C-methylase UbiE
VIQPVDYDVLAPAYDRRYEYRGYDGTRASLRRFLGNGSAAVIEIGCGTGYWLRELAGTAELLAGMDLSAGMLQRARIAAPTAHLVRANAASLPWATASVDRVFCVNVLHHIPDQGGFLRECRRIVKPGGGILTIGLDPHTGTDDWWVYDYFPTAIRADRERYSSTDRVRELLGAAGFNDASTEVADVLTGSVPFAVARDRGSVHRGTTSQLMVITDAEYESGMNRLLRDQPDLQTHLRLFSTTAWAPLRSTPLEPQ